MPTRKAPKARGASVKNKIRPFVPKNQRQQPMTAQELLTTKKLAKPQIVQQPPKTSAANGQFALPSLCCADHFIDPEVTWGVAASGFGMPFAPLEYWYD